MSSSKKLAYIIVVLVTLWIFSGIFTGNSKKQETTENSAPEIAKVRIKTQEAIEKIKEMYDDLVSKNVLSEESEAKLIETIKSFLAANKF